MKHPLDYFSSPKTDQSGSKVSDDNTSNIIEQASETPAMQDFYSKLLNKNNSSLSRLKSNLEAFNDDLTEEEIEQHIKYASGQPMPGLPPEAEAMHFTWEHARTYLLFKQATLSFKADAPVSLAQAYQDVFPQTNDADMFRRLTREDPLESISCFARYKIVSHHTTTSLLFIFSDLYLVRAQCFREALLSSPAGDFFKRLLRKFPELFAEFCSEIREISQGSPLAAELEDDLNYLIAKHQIFYLAKDIVDVRSNQTADYLLIRNKVQSDFAKLHKLLCKEHNVAITQNRQSECTTLLRRIADNTDRAPASQRDAIAIIREVRNAHIKGVTSYEKATNYLRHMVADPNNPFYQKAMWLRSYVTTHSKKVKSGTDACWNTLSQYAKPSAEKQRGKAKHKGEPIITPILAPGT